MPYRLVTEDTVPQGFPEEYPTLDDWKSEGKDVRLWMDEHCSLLAQANLLLKQGRDWVALIDTARATQAKGRGRSVLRSDGASETTGQTRWGALMELRRLPSFAGVYYSQSVNDAFDASLKNVGKFLDQAIDDQGTTWGDIIGGADPSISLLGVTDDNIDPTNCVIKVEYLCTSNPPCPTPQQIKDRILNAKNTSGTSVSTGMRAFGLSLAVEVVTSLPTAGGIHTFQLTKEQADRYLQTLNKKP